MEREPWRSDPNPNPGRMDEWMVSRYMQQLYQLGQYYISAEDGSAGTMS